MTIQCYEEKAARNAIQITNGGISDYIRNLWNSFSALRAKIKKAKTDRDAFRTIARLDDAMLKDIGLTRGDVTWASQLPLSTNAACELEIIARRKAHKPR